MKEHISEPDLLEGFLAGDPEATRELGRRFDPELRKRITPLPAAIAGLGLEDDVIQQTWELVLRAGPGRYDPARGPLVGYLYGHLRNARRDVMAAHAPIGETHRSRKDADGFHVPWQPSVPLEQFESLFVEIDEIPRALDRLFADELEAKAVTLSMPVAADLIVLLRQDFRLGEAALELGLSRFRARRALNRFSAALEP